MELSSIITIFEFYSNSINQERNNFISPKIWDEISISLSRIVTIDNLSNTYNTKPIRFPEYSSHVALVEVKQDITNYKILDVIRISFNSFFPNIIKSLVEEGILKPSSKLSMFSLLLSNISEIRKELTFDAKICLKIFINYFYGKLDKDERELVLGRSHLILNHLSSIDGWLYTDIDTVFIIDSLGTTDTINQKLSILEMPYDIDNIKELLILDKKKLVIIDDDGMGSINGIRLLKK